METATRFPVILGVLLVSQVTFGESFIVSHPGDSGPGSLTHAIEKANQQPGEDTIRFVSDLFLAPYTLPLSKPLPIITDALIIDGYIANRLWTPSGITLDAGGQFSLFQVASDASLTLRYLTLSNGKAEQGGAIYSEGTLILDSLLITDNQARQGGAVFQQGGDVFVINSTLLNNQASQQGGALYADNGSLSLIHNTITGNRAPEGAGFYRLGPVQLGNNIIALNQPGNDAECLHSPEPDSHANLIIHSQGCGTPAFSDDPGLDTLGYYNGPTRTLPLRGNSPVINQADNTLSVDANGEPLVWDQRGNGDPRFAGGIADMGAFEKQAVIQLQVDTLTDDDIRRCTRLRHDCSLRGAIALLNATAEPGTLSLDPQRFPADNMLTLSRPLPPLVRDITLKLQQGQTLEVVGHGGLPTAGEGRLIIENGGSDP